jgi:hypothetical protein
MIASNKHAVMLASRQETGTQFLLGFYIEHGDTSSLEEYLEKTWQKDISDLTDDQLLERMSLARNDVNSQGYVTGPIQSKTRKQWIVEVFGVLPQQESEQDEQDEQDEHDEYES